MKILIIGNGFDLAHGLKTSYTDFLNVLVKNSLFHKYLLQNKEIDSEFFMKVVKSSLVEFFKTQSRELGGWIDFENELKTIVNDISKFPDLLIRRTDTNFKYIYQLPNEKVSELSLSLLRFTDSKNGRTTTWNERNLNKFILSVHGQISDFIKLFEYYIIWVNEVEMTKVSKKKLFEEMKVTNVLCFNYTETYSKVYNSDNQIKNKNICYVHGKVNQFDTNGIVMGIGSNFYNDEINDEFVDLFKFYQRYKFNTNDQYKCWITPNNTNKQCNVIIYGHSLDPTDEDILKPFFEIPNAKIKIYYLNNENRYRLEINILKILGKKKFSEYMDGENSKVYFEKVKSEI